VIAQLEAAEKRNWKQLPKPASDVERGVKRPLTTPWTCSQPAKRPANNLFQSFSGATCKCIGNNAAVKRTVKKDGPNKGKEFWTCGSVNRCNFFQWVDPGASSGYRGARRGRKGEDSFSNRLPNDLGYLSSAVDVKMEIVSIRPPLFGLKVTPYQTDPRWRSIVKEAGGVWASKQGRWHIHINEIENLEARIKDLAPTANVTCPPIRIIKNVRTWAAKPPLTVGDEVFNSLPPLLNKKLYEFQREGFKFVLARSGRALIADEMGLGKTIQAIACALYYRARHEWPLLVICPSSMKYPWRDEIIRWTRDLRQQLDVTRISIINTRKAVLSDSDVYIMSYAIATSKQDELLNMEFKVVIVDESHAIKSWKSARTKVITRILRQAKRCFLLSGTPMNNRPAELHSQIDSLRPGEFMKKKKFSIRYCDGHDGHWGWTEKGATHTDELHVLLKERVMIRRLKSEVLDQLPAKQKTIVIIDIKRSKELKVAMKRTEELKSQLEEAISNNEGVAKNNELRASTMECYGLTGAAKADKVCEYIGELAQAGEKFLVFCHHLAVMDTLQEYVQKKIKCGYIRIDGSTKAKERSEKVKTFQTQPQTQIAILSITAAGVGLTLTAASIVIFAELYWCPSSLLQCEDRVHRIGQKSCVNIYYVLGKNTMDDLLWPMIERKLQVTGSCLSGEAVYMNINSTEKFNKISHSEQKSANVMNSWLGSQDQKNNSAE